MYVEKPGDDLVAWFLFALMLAVAAHLTWEAFVEDRVRWTRMGVNLFEAQERGFGARIHYADAAYVVTIKGPGAPAPSSHPTLNAAKKAFRKFLLSRVKR
jgi:hypothetical protein